MAGVVQGQASAEPRRVAIACQGGGSHAALVAGALQPLLARAEAGGVRVVGISGTSGGAICAALAWFGLVLGGSKGGAAAAKRLLDALWLEGNAARTPTERLWNFLSVEMTRHAPAEPHVSPYQWPLWSFEEFLKWLPTLPRIVDWPPRRKDFFDLKNLLEEYIDFVALRRIGALVVYAADVRRDRQRAALGASLMIAGGGLAPAGAGQWLPPPVTTDSLAQLRIGIDGALAALADLPDEHRLPLPEDDDTGAPAPAITGAFAEIKARAQAARATLAAGPSGDSIDSTLEWLEQSVLAPVVVDVPVLLLGAVEVLSGTFKAFSSERGLADRESGQAVLPRRSEVSVHAVAASATLPWIFESEQEVGDGGAYWDGLFSQNPPVRNFLTDAGGSGAKPDEIWLIRVNPQERRKVPRTYGEIDDRRNELSGNLSVNQETLFIEQVNAWIAASRLDQGGRFKPIDIHEVVMNHDQLGDLDAPSKLGRDVDFMRTLVDHGRHQGALFLFVREVLTSVLRQPDGAARQAAAARVTEGAAAELAGAVDPLFALFDPNVELAVGHTKIDGAAGNPACVTFDWTARGRPKGGVTPLASPHHRSLKLSGTAELLVAGTTPGEFRVTKCVMRPKSDTFSFD